MYGHHDLQSDGNAGTRTDTLNVVYNNGTTSQTATLAISATADPVPQQGAGVLTAVWANDGGDKVAREERRASINAASVVNTVWDGAKSSCSAPKRSARFQPCT